MTSQNADLMIVRGPLGMAISLASSHVSAKRNTLPKGPRTIIGPSRVGAKQMTLPKGPRTIFVTLPPGLIRTIHKEIHRAPA